MYACISIMQSERILVTGGAGFIGSAVVDALLARGHDVAVLDDLSSGSERNLSSALETGGARLYVGDIRSDLVRSVSSEEKPGVVMHLAAQIEVARSVES